MKKFRILLLLSLFAVLMTVFGNSFAQENDKPAIKITDVVTDESFVILTRNFPASTKYTVSLADPENLENYTAIARFTSGNSGTNKIAIKVTDRFKGLKVIALKLEDEQGNVILGEYTNIPEEPAAEEPAAEEPVTEEPAADEPAPAPEEEIKLVNEEPEAQTEPEGEKIKLVNEEPEAEAAPEEPAPAEGGETVTEEPAEPEAEVTEPVEEPKAEETVPAETAEEIPVLVCNYAVIPSVHIDAVTKDSSVTFTTYNFPANSTFSVAMGTYIATWAPAPMGHPGYIPSGHHHEPAHGVYVNPDVYADWPTFTVIGSTEPAHVPGFRPTEKPSHGPAPRPAGGVVTSSSFSGVDAGSFETGDGSSQTLTFSIPESIKGTNPIAIWISDQGPCGFYSYNYFYNNSTH